MTAMPNLNHIMREHLAVFRPPPESAPEWLTVALGHEMAHIKRLEYARNIVFGLLFFCRSRFIRQRRW
jgi:hypothetical protein